MKALVQITHPAHVHFFRPFIREARELGHDIGVIAVQRDISLDLLDNYNIAYDIVSEPIERDPSLGSADLLSRIRRQSLLTMETYRVARRAEPDVLTSVGGTSVSHASKFIRGKSVVFYDTEHATFQNMITYPFADRVYTPDCYERTIGSNQVRYPGYQELAYLHPNRFSPDPTVKGDAGLSEDERFVIFRMVSWDSVHDIGDRGFDNVADVVAALEETGVRVLITSEAPLPESLERCRVSVEPHRMHHLLYYADLYVGESATMATESAVLGTPAVFVSSSQRGYTNELESKYGIVFNYNGEHRQKRALKKTLELLTDYDDDEWTAKRERILEDKIDTTEVLLTVLLGEERRGD